MGGLTTTYDSRRERLRDYFDGTALDTWTQLTSDAPVSKVRATVRAGRDEMRALLISWLPTDLTGRRLLDAGCGTGSLSAEAAARGADAVGVDIAGGLISVAQQRTPRGLPGSTRFLVGDMLSPALGRFDHVAAMDSLIHYEADDLVRMVATLAERTERSILFTFAPWSVPLAAMHKVGQIFPRSDRSPAIAPVREEDLRSRFANLKGWSVRRSQRVTSGFYISNALELVRD